MLTKRRINLYGGPSTGKSTTAADLFSRLKNKLIHEQLSIHVELVQEFVKNWAYEGRKLSSYDQVFIFAQQLHREDIILRNNVDLIVTDSPLLLNYSYAEKEQRPGYKGILPIVQEFEQTFPGLHIFLDRGDRPYVSKGRYQNEQEAKQMDSFIRGMLEKHLPNNFVVVKYNDLDSIMAIINYHLDLPIEGE